MAPCPDIKHTEINDFCGVRRKRDKNFRAVIDIATILKKFTHDILLIFLVLSFKF
jgi:hypothetical protein